MAVVTESPRQIPFSKYLAADGWALHWSTDRSYESTSVLLRKMWQWQSLSLETLAVYWRMGWDLGLEFPWVTICNWGSSSGGDLLWKPFFSPCQTNPDEKGKTAQKVLKRQKVSENSDLTALALWATVLTQGFLLLSRCFVVLSHSVCPVAFPTNLPVRLFKMQSHSASPLSPAFLTSILPSTCRTPRFLPDLNTFHCRSAPIFDIIPGEKADLMLVAPDWGLHELVSTPSFQRDPSRMTEPYLQILSLIWGY